MVNINIRVNKDNPRELQVFFEDFITSKVADMPDYFDMDKFIVEAQKHGYSSVDFTYDDGDDIE